MGQSIEFYSMLGFIQIVDTAYYARFECPEGEATFSLSLEITDYVNGTVIYFEHKELDKWVLRIKEKGVVFAQDPTDERYFWREAVLYDPSGNKIKLYWAGDNKRNPPWCVK